MTYSCEEKIKCDIRRTLFKIETQVHKNNKYLNEYWLKLTTCKLNGIIIFLNKHKIRNTIGRNHNSSEGRKFCCLFLKTN